MATREEIREGLLSTELTLTRLAARIIKSNLDKSPIEMGNLIVKVFHSQGVVIKVDRELPEPTNLYSGGDAETVSRRAFDQLLEDGYTATEPLIKED